MVGAGVGVVVVVVEAVVAQVVAGVLCAGNKDTHFRTNPFSMFHVTDVLL